MSEFLNEAPASHRYDIYLPIHKGLRAFMCQLLPEVGRIDTDDEAAVAETLEALRVLLALCQAHAHKEDTMVHPALEARAPGTTAQAEDEHRTHQVSLDILAAQADLVARAHGCARATAALRLYRLLALLVGESFLHMHAEEIEHNAVLWATHSDAELRELEARIVATLSPEESALALRWILPALTPAERLDFLLPIRDNAPAAVLEDILAMIRPHLDGADWIKLEVGLRRAA
jgi:hypothetical protein